LAIAKPPRKETGGNSTKALKLLRAACQICQITGQCSYQCGLSATCSHILGSCSTWKMHLCVTRIFRTWEPNINYWHQDTLHQVLPSTSSSSVNSEAPCPMFTAKHTLAFSVQRYPGSFPLVVAPAALRIVQCSARRSSTCTPSTQFKKANTVKSRSPSKVGGMKNDAQSHNAPLLHAV